MDEASGASSESELLEDEEVNLSSDDDEQRGLEASPILDHFRTTFKQELLEINANAKNAHEVMGSFVQLHAQMYEETLNVAVGVYIHEQKAAWKKRHMLQKQGLRARNGELSNGLESTTADLESRTAELEDALQQCLALLNENTSLKKQLAAAGGDVSGNLEEMKAEARREGEAEGRRKALEDLNTSMEREHIALRRSHMERLGEVRASSYEEGFVAGSQSSQAGTPCPQPKSNSIKPSLIDLDSPKPDQQKAIVAAMEHGRRQGREHAYRELALSPGDRVDTFLQSHSDLNKNRKVHCLDRFRIFLLIRAGTRIEDHPPELARCSAAYSTILHATARSHPRRQNTLPTGQVEQGTRRSQCHQALD